MNSTQQAISAYGKENTHLRTHRGIEAEVCAQVTRAITLASGDKKHGFPKVAAALHSNRRLWRALASDVSNAENALPADMRARVFYLSEFVNEQTGKVLRGDATVDALREVNMSIMRGLNMEATST